MKFCVGIRGHEGIKPSDTCYLTAFPLVPPADESFNLSSEILEYLLDKLIQFVQTFMFPRGLVLLTLWMPRLFLYFHHEVDIFVS